MRRYTGKLWKAGDYFSLDDRNKTIYRIEKFIYGENSLAWMVVVQDIRDSYRGYWIEATIHHKEVVRISEEEVTRYLLET